jgi:hypothetical protein
MLLPKIDVEVGESVHREAMRDLVKYAKDKALELNKENKVLSTLVYTLARQVSQGDEDLFQQIYFAMLVALNIVNTQMEVNELKEIYS